MADFKIRYKIEGDSTDAKRALAEVDAKIDQLGAGKAGGLSGVANGLESLAGPAALAAGAIAAVGAAALTAYSALFELSRSASEFGSEIFDASKKTGLSAETLSAMKFAADQSGASLEKITGGLARFSKTIGDATDGSKQAARDLEALGITPQEAINDLDAALGKVFQRIIEAPPGIERMTLAQRAFGRSGADLLPFLDSFDGDLAGLVKRARELGVTIDDEAAAAADEFGDQLDTLNAQLAGVGRTIGIELMPVFLEWSTSLSEWLVRNRGEISAWSTGFSRAVAFSASSIYNNIDAFAGFGEILVGIANTDWNRVVAGVTRIGNAVTAQRSAYDALTAPGGGGGQPDAGGRGIQLGSTFEPPGSRAAKGRGGRAPKDNSEREAERAERERIRMVKENAAIEIAEKQASTAMLIQLEKQRYAEGLLNEEQYVRSIREHEMVLSGFILDSKQRELEQLRNNADEEKRLISEIKILNLEQERTLAEYAEADAIRRKKKAEQEEADHRRRVNRWNETVRRLKEIADAEAEADAAATRRAREAAEAQMATAPGTLGGGILGGLGEELVPMFDEATNAMLTFQDRMALVKADINDFVGNAIGGMIQGLAQMAASWLATGEFSARAALQMLSSVAFSIAAQAAIKAVFEAAEAVAAAARWDFVAAGLHSTAASMYATVAVIAGAAGVGLALGARALGGGKGSSRGGSSDSGSIGTRSQQQQNQQPLTRQNGDTFISGRRSDPATMALARAVDKLQAKIDTASAGDVLVRGANQRKGFITETMLNETGRNSGYGTRLSRSMGIR